MFSYKLVIYGSEFYKWKAIERKTETSKFEAKQRNLTWEQLTNSICRRSGGALCLRTQQFETFGSRKCNCDNSRRKSASSAFLWKNKHIFSSQKVSISNSVHSFELANACWNSNSSLEFLDTTWPRKKNSRNIDFGYKEQLLSTQDVSWQLSIRATSN